MFRMIVKSVYLARYWRGSRLSQRRATSKLPLISSQHTFLMELMPKTVSGTKIRTQRPIKRLKYPFLTIISQHIQLHSYLNYIFITAICGSTKSLLFFQVSTKVSSHKRNAIRIKVIHYKPFWFFFLKMVDFSNRIDLIQQRCKWFFFLSPNWKSFNNLFRRWHH